MANRDETREGLARKYDRESRRCFRLAERFSRDRREFAATAFYEEAAVYAERARQIRVNGMSLV